MRLVLAIAVLGAACGKPDGGRREPPAPVPAHDAAAMAVAPLAGAEVPAGPTTPDQLLAAGPPTLVVGTRGDDRADRSIAAQAELIRGLIPGATVVLDTSIDLAAGPAAWPARPILYGGSHVNHVIAGLGAALPIQVDADRLVVGGEIFAGHGDRVIALIPARAAGADGVGHPAFAWYAGTGTPGIVDINAFRHGGEAILIGDGFGRLRTGAWARGAEDAPVARLEPALRRIPWRTIERQVAGVPMRVAFPAQLGARDDDDAVADAIARGLARSAERLAMAAPASLTVYVYPDRRSKESLTGDRGDGHAVAMARALHVVHADPAPGGGLERLLAHEGTHAFVGDAWGAAGSALLGEGLAVWVSGAYAGVSLATWRTRLDARPAAAALLPVRGFRARPEAESYPLAGLLVGVAIELVGLEAVRDRLYGAGVDDWDAACARAGTTAAKLDARFAATR